MFECIRGCGGASSYDARTGECDAGEPGAVAVCELKCRVPCVPSTLSHHLNVLRDAGLIETKRQGRKVYARVIEASLCSLSAYFEFTATPHLDAGRSARG